MDCAERIGMIVAKRPASSLESLPDVGFGLAQLTLPLQQHTHVVDRGERAGVVLAEYFAESINGFLDIRLGLLEPARLERVSALLELLVARLFE